MNTKRYIPDSKQSTWFIQNKVHGLYKRKRSGWAKRGERHDKKEKRPGRILTQS
jgi:hypothetical protein